MSSSPPEAPTERPSGLWAFGTNVTCDNVTNDGPDGRATKVYCGEDIIGCFRDFKGAFPEPGSRSSIGHRQLAALLAGRGTDERVTAREGHAHLPPPRQPG
jgi:hypothetical protein